MFKRRLYTEMHLTRSQMTCRETFDTQPPPPHPLTYLATQSGEATLSPIPTKLTQFVISSSSAVREI